MKSELLKIQNHNLNELRQWGKEYFYEYYATKEIFF